MTATVQVQTSISAILPGGQSCRTLKLVASGASDGFTNAVFVVTQEQEFVCVSTLAQLYELSAQPVDLFGTGLPVSLQQNGGCQPCANVPADMPYMRVSTATLQLRDPSQESTVVAELLGRVTKLCAELEMQANQGTPQTYTVTSSGF